VAGHNKEVRLWFVSTARSSSTGFVANKNLLRLSEGPDTTGDTFSAYICQFTNESPTDYASLCSIVNTNRPQHTCRHSVRLSRLSQPVVSCGQQPKATSITREQELSHKAHGHLQLLNLHVGTYFRHLWSHRRWNPLICVNRWWQYSWRSRRNYVTRFARLEIKTVH